MIEIQVDTGAISAAANHLEALKTQLEATLRESSDIVNSLDGSWNSPAASDAVGSYRSFGARYFTEYGKRMEAFSQYLHNITERNWEEAETRNRDITGDLP